MRIVLAGILALIVAGSVVAIDTEYVPYDQIQGQHWDFKFEFKTPRRIVMAQPDGTQKAFWVVVYTVTNIDKEVHDFQPGALMLTDSGRVAKDGLYPEVVEKVKKEYRLQELADTSKIRGQLKAGEDEARDGVFVFPEADVKMDQFTLFITGLSGEYVLKTLPAAKEGQEAKTFALYKTMQLVFKFPGDEENRSADKVYFVGQKWIWR
jgi:hypothetical protein